MTKKILLATLLTLSFASARAGSIETRFQEESEKPALDLFSLGASYVFESQLSLDGGGNFGDQDVFSFNVEYSHRFHLTGPVYLRAGVAYNRFDFGDTGAPVPEKLQSLAGIVGLEYLVGNDVGAFLQARPGFYTENDFDGDSFDAPITIGRIWILQEKKLYLLTGANFAGLRGEYPLLPLVGLIWYPSEQWSVYALVPEPRITYAPNKNFSVWAGGQLAGGSFRTDESATILPRRLDHAQIDYSEYRVGGGFDFRCGEAVTITVAGGYAIERRLNFERAGVEFDTDPAPYIRAGLKAEF